MGTHLPPQKKNGSSAPNFRPMSIVAKRLDGSRCHLAGASWRRPRPHCVRWGPSAPPPHKGAQQPSTFQPMSIVAKRSPISATAELLLHSSWQSVTGMPEHVLSHKNYPLASETPFNTRGQVWMVQSYSLDCTNVHCRPCNTCFLGLTIVHNPNGISTSSAIFAQQPNY